jgi:acetylornithine/N-succinyldiaminopimelate aminotransferase
VSNVGHRHPRVVKAIHEQLDKYMHLMVYGEYIQSPQVLLAQKIAELLPPALNCSYFTNSGAEAIEGALKLAKRITGRSELVSFENAYHGSTQGALSIMGSEFFKMAFRPLLPGTRMLRYNNFDDLELISSHTACVVVEPVQGEAGAVVPAAGFLRALRKRCDDTGALLIYDEIQTGFGRTGKLFGFQHEGAIPDIIVFAKGMGGGLPIGAFVSSRENMNALTDRPVLGHITTFGGNPVCCAAALATIETILDEKLVEGVAQREKIILDTLKHPAIKALRGKGLLYAAVLPNEEIAKAAIREAIHEGIVTDWFLFCDNALRIAPPLTIGTDVLRESCEKLVACIDKAARS